MPGLFEDCQSLREPVNPCFEFWMLQHGRLAFELAKESVNGRADWGRFRLWPRALWSAMPRPPVHWAPSGNAMLPGSAGWPARRVGPRSGLNLGAVVCIMSRSPDFTYARAP